jgi:hypothetical protein
MGVHACLAQKANKSTYPAAYVQDRGGLDLGQNLMGNGAEILYRLLTLTRTSGLAGAIGRASWLRAFHLTQRNLPKEGTSDLL